MLKALISPFMLVIAGILVYANSLSNPFIYDDQVAIVDNVDIRQLWPPSWVSPTTLEHAPTNSRPVVSFTLALNYAFGTLDVRGFRAFNIAVHILCSFAIYLVLNQTFSNAEGRALTVALLWLVHPLNSQCIQYVIQRSESLMRRTASTEQKLKRSFIAAHRTISSRLHSRLEPCPAAS